MTKSTLARKFLMAISGFFLIFFLFQHLVINLLSVISESYFNNASHFMGTNFLVQFLLQPVLIFGVMFHLIMGMYLDYKNKSARPINYTFNKPDKNTSWVSRNMIITGIMIMLFLALHFYDFWIPEIKTKFIDGDWTGMHNNNLRYHHELVYKFEKPWRVGIYCISFIFLSLHLLHGFQSAFQSAGFNHNKYTPVIKKIGNLYAILIPFGFIMIAVFHYLKLTPILDI